jgi:hypothetical protein
MAPARYSAREIIGTDRLSREGIANMASLKEIPDSSAGAQAKWYLARMLAKGEGASTADKDHYTPEVSPRFTAHESDEKRARRVGRLRGADG